MGNYSWSDPKLCYVTIVRPVGETFQHLSTAWDDTLEGAALSAYNKAKAVVLSPQPAQDTSPQELPPTIS